MKGHGECHNKLMPAAGMLQCDIFISNERQKSQINKMFGLMVDAVKAGVFQEKNNDFNMLCLSCNFVGTHFIIYISVLLSIMFQNLPPKIRITGSWGNLFQLHVTCYIDSINSCIF